MAVFSARYIHVCKTRALVYAFWSLTLSTRMCNSCCLDRRRALVPVTATNHSCCLLLDRQTKADGSSNCQSVLRLAGFGPSADTCKSQTTLELILAYSAVYNQDVQTYVLHVAWSNHEDAVGSHHSCQQLFDCFRQVNTTCSVQGSGYCGVYPGRLLLQQWDQRPFG